MTIKHTPGPWAVSIKGTGIAIIAPPDKDAPNGRHVGRATSGARNVLENARLIAAAPELLAILERILYANDTDNCGVVNGEAVLCRHLAETARAAIAKAKAKGDTT